MTTRHSQAVGATVIDWKKTLTQIIADKLDLSPMQKTWLVDKALSWNTCACGQLDEGIPHRIPAVWCERLGNKWSGIPEDQELYELGLSFGLAVAQGGYRQALALVEKIHDRSDQLGYPVPSEVEEDPIMPYRVDAYPMDDYRRDYDMMHSRIAMRIEEMDRIMMNSRLEVERMRREHETDRSPVVAEFV